MKKIIKPLEKEQAVYYCDFSGKCFGDWDPHVDVKIEFNYGSKYDSSKIVLHLSDKESESLIDLIKSKLSDDYKDHLKKELSKQDEEYCSHVDFRDWEACEQKINSIALIEHLLDKQQ